MSNFLDIRHNLYVGWVAGIAWRNGVNAEPVLDEAGNVTDRLAIHFDTADNVEDKISITVVVPPPPADWEL